jgi:ADP-ribose diphosphatase
MKSVVGVEVQSTQVIGGGGFLEIRRQRLRNRRADDSLSEYLCDFVDRPRGLDAVAVVVYTRDDSGVRVLIRHGLRPSLVLGRQPPEASPMFAEVVAGILETTDAPGGRGIRERAAAEVWEEAGFVVAPDDIVQLGAATLPAPGVLPEKLILCAVQVADPSAQAALVGDGSPMEEGATTRWLDLDDAIAASWQGALCDAKTELTLRRLRDYLVA